MAKTDPILIPMLTDATADETTSTPVPLNNASAHWHAAEFSDDSTGGVVIVEMAATRDWEGAWEEITRFTAADHAAKQLEWPGTGGFVRHRIETVISGGADPKVTSYCRRTFLK